MPTNVTQISGATQADIYLGNYAYSDILASMAALRFKLDTAGTNRLFYKNAAGALFKVMCDASAGTNHASGRGLYTDANGAAQSSADFRFSGVLLGIGDAINGITTSHHITVGDAGAADYPQILIGKDTDNFFQVFHDNQNGYFALQQKAGGVTYSNMIVGKLGNIGVGTATPDNKLHVEISDSGTNTILYPFKISRATSGTPAANIGVGMTFEAETKYGTTDGDLTARIRTYWTDAVTSMGEDSAMGIDVYSNDSFVEALQLRHNCGGFYLGGDALPSWSNDIYAIAIGDKGYGIYGVNRATGDTSGVFHNVYSNSGWKLIAADPACQIQMAAGVIKLITYATGSADGAASVVSQINYDNAGKLHGYSDEESTEKWSIACATGIAQFDGDVYTVAETTWVPTIAVSGGTAPQYSTTTAYYKKVGNFVFCSLLLSGDGGSEGAGANTLTITTPTNISANWQALGSGVYRNNTTYGGIFVGRNATNTIYLTITSTGVVVTGDSQNHASRYIIANFSYEAA